MLPLVVGDPSHKPATFTRFVLPFAYKPSKGESLQPSEPCFRFVPDTDRFRWRKQYLTEETAGVLFEKARWAEFKGRTWPREIPIHFRGGRTINIGMSPPLLVLFEFPDEKRRKAEGTDLLHTGFLIVEIFFPEPERDGKKPCLDDLLELNELFRYWRRPYEEHDMADEEHRRYVPLLSEVPASFKAPRSTIEKPAGFDIYFERWISLLEFPLTDGCNTWRLFPEEWGDGARKWVEGQSVDRPHCMVYADDRCYVWTCAMLENGSFALKKFGSGNTEPHAHGHWIKLLNVDQPGSTACETGRSTQFERDWAKDRTYFRWAHFGTLYGFNYHAGAMMGAPITEPPTWNHFRETYLDQALLLLYIRTTLFRFSKRLTEITAEKQKSRKSWNGSEFMDLREAFADFTNLYQFPLLSNQQQAIEMYSLAREHFDIKDFYDEIHEEVRSTYEFLEMKKSSTLENRADLIAKWGLPAALLGVVAALFSMSRYTEIPLDQSTNSTLMNHIHFERLPLPTDNAWVFLFLLTALGLGFFLGWKKRGKNSSTRGGDQ